MLTKDGIHKLVKYDNRVRRQIIDDITVQVIGHIGNRYTLSDGKAFRTGYFYFNNQVKTPSIYNVIRIKKFSVNMSFILITEMETISEHKGIIGDPREYGEDDKLRGEKQEENSRLKKDLVKEGIETHKNISKNNNKNIRNSLDSMSLQSETKSRSGVSLIKITGLFKPNPTMFSPQNGEVFSNPQKNEKSNSDDSSLNEYVGKVAYNGDLCNISFSENTVTKSTVTKNVTTTIKITGSESRNLKFNKDSSHNKNTNDQSEIKNLIKPLSFRVPLIEPIQENEYENKRTQDSNLNKNDFSHKQKLDFDRLSSLTPFTREFTCKVRIIHHAFRNNRGWEMIITDKFRTCAVLFIPYSLIDNFKFLIRKSHVYQIENGKINLDKDKEDTIIIATENTKISEIFNDDNIFNTDIEEKQYTPLSEIPILKALRNVSLLVFIFRTDDTMFFYDTYDNERIFYKKIEVVDSSNTKCFLHLERDFADRVKCTAGDILYLKNLTKNFDVKGLKLQTNKNSFVEVNPNCEKANELRSYIKTMTIFNYNNLSKDLSDGIEEITCRDMNRILENNPYLYRIYKIKATTRNIPGRQFTIKACNVCLTELSSKILINECPKCKNGSQIPHIIYNLKLIIYDHTTQLDCVLNSYMSEMFLKQCVSNFDTSALMMRKETFKKVKTSSLQHISKARNEIPWQEFFFFVKAARKSTIKVEHYPQIVGYALVDRKEYYKSLLNLLKTNLGINHA